MTALLFWVLGFMAGWAVTAGVHAYLHTAARDHNGAPPIRHRQG